MALEAVIVSDAHARDGDDAGLARLDSFLREVAPRTRRLYILGDFFEFWFGPKQALKAPYAGILARLGELAKSGVEIVFFHGNRDFYFDDEFASRFGIRVVDDYSIETIAGRRVYLAHGDLLCANDRGYHRMRAIVRNRLMRTIFRHLPAATAERLARWYRERSKRTAAAKSQWTLRLDDEAVKRAFRMGADAAVMGHVHRAGEKSFDLGEGRRVLYMLGDFSSDGSYIAVSEKGFEFRTA